MKGHRLSTTIFLLLTPVLAAFLGRGQTNSGQNFPPGPAEETKGLKAFLWRDPGDVRSLDLGGGPLGRDGAPRPPYVFHEEEGGGTSPKIVVTDGSRRTWEVKWGEEAHPEVFATNILWAVGYFVEPEYFVPSGTIDSVGALSRAKRDVKRESGNSFKNARFEYRDPRLFRTLTKGWVLNSNPFVGTHELAGLKVMAMLLSDWDLKDPRAPDGSNTAIVRYRNDDGTEELHYFVNDWGATMGKWGGYFERSKWNCKGYTAETPEFVEGVKDGHVRFRYKGKFTSDIAGEITVEDVRWLMQYLGAITDDQLRAGLQASGADPSQSACYVSAVRERIEELRRVATTQGARNDPRFGPAPSLIH